MAAGLAGRLFVFLLHGLHHKLGQWMPNPYLRIVLVGALVALFGLVTGGRYNGLSEEISAAALAGEQVYLWDWLAKLCLTAVCLSAGFQGGEVAPLFTVGAALGAVLAVPLGLPAPLAAALAYAGVFCAGTIPLPPPSWWGWSCSGASTSAACSWCAPRPRLQRQPLHLSPAAGGPGLNLILVQCAGICYTFPNQIFAQEGETVLKIHRHIAKRLAALMQAAVVVGTSAPAALAADTIGGADTAQIPVSQEVDQENCISWLLDLLGLAARTKSRWTT